MLYECLVAVRIELCDIPHTFEEQCIAMFTRSCYQLIELALASQHIRIALVCREVDGQCDELLAHDWLRAVDNQLVNQWDAIGVGERCLGFVFET